MAQTFPDSSYLNRKCQEAFRSTWVTKGFKMNSDLNQSISKTYTIDDLIKAIRGSVHFEHKHHRLLCIAESNLKIARGTIQQYGGAYPIDVLNDLRSTFLAIGSDFFYASEGITVGKRTDQRPLSKAQAEAKLMEFPRKAKATTKTTKESFTLVSSPLTRHATLATQNVPGAFPTPLNSGHRNLSQVNLTKQGKALEGSRAYNPDDDPDLEVVVSEEVEWDLVSKNGDDKEVDIMVDADFVVLGKEQ